MARIKFQIEEKYFIPKKYDMSNINEILTERESQVFRCLCIDKLKTKDIAAKLGIDRPSVSHRLTAIIHKIQNQGTDEFKSRFSTFLKQNKIKRDRTCKMKTKNSERYPDGVFLTQNQMKNLLKNNEKP